MTEMIGSFLQEYANPQNCFLAGAVCILILFILRLIFALCSLRDLKKINRVLREQEGDDILRCIEDLNLSRRYAQMWDDYYDAYCARDTVALSEYLIVRDKFAPFTLYRDLSRAFAALSLAGAVASQLLVPGLSGGWNVFWIALACMAAYVLFFEALFALVETVRARRLRYLSEEFRMLSLRKLPGKAVDFSQRYLLQAFDRVLKELHETRAALTQVNARLDRQYRTILSKTDAGETET